MTWYSRELDLGKSKTKKQNKVRKNSADAFGKNAEAKKEIRRAVLFLFFGRILFDTGIFRVKQIGEIIQKLFYNLLFNIDVKTQVTDKCKQLQRIPVILRSFIKTFFRRIIRADNFFFKFWNSGLFQFAYFFIDRSDIKILICVKILIRNRL